MSACYYQKLLLLVLYSTAIMSTAMQTGPPHINTSNTEHKSEIHELEARKEEYADSFRLWNRWYIGFAAITVLAGVGVWFAQRGALRKSAAISALNDKIAELHRQDFEAELKAKDVEIEFAKRDAAAAYKAAGETHERPVANEKEAERLKLETERLAPVKCEERLAARTVSKLQHDRFVQMLKPFRGSLVDLVEVEEGEANNFANGIRQVLEDSEWLVTRSSSEMRIPALYGLTCTIDNRQAAGKTLAEVLRQLGCTNPALQFSSTRGSIGRIVIGLKPPP
jgi:hypothetical protein